MLTLGFFSLFIEMFLTAELVLTVLFIAAEKSRATFLAPVAIGLSLFVAELTGLYQIFRVEVLLMLTILLGVYYTGGSLNPARSFGPDVANRQFDGYHWIYWLGVRPFPLLSGQKHCIQDGDTQSTYVSLHPGRRMLTPEFTSLYLEPQ